MLRPDLIPHLNKDYLMNTYIKVKLSFQNFIYEKMDYIVDCMWIVIKTLNLSRTTPFPHPYGSVKRTKEKERKKFNKGFCRVRLGRE